MKKSEEDRKIDLGNKNTRDFDKAVNRLTSNKKGGVKALEKVIANAKKHKLDREYIASITIVLNNWKRDLPKDMW